jgi:hypothetical protein
VAREELIECRAGRTGQGQRLTLRLIVVACVKLPNTPVTVTVNVPVAAELLAVSVSVLVPVAGFGLNDAVVPLPMPFAESVTPPVKPPEGWIVTVLVPCEPRVILTLVGEAESVKLGDEAGFTVNRIVVELPGLLELPLIVTVTVPVVAVLLAVSVRTLVVVAGFVLKLAVTPEGRPEADSVTLPLKPSTGVTVIVVVPPGPPCVIATLAGDADKLNVGDVAGAARALINPLFGLPQPVAKSYPVVAEEPSLPLVTSWKSES